MLTVHEQLAAIHGEDFEPSAKFLPSITDQLNAYHKALNAEHEDPQIYRAKRRRQYALELVTQQPMFAREIAQKMGVTLYSVYQYMNDLLREEKVTYDMVMSVGQSPQRRWRAI